MKKRKSYSKELKARVALDAIKGQKTVSELACEYGIHTNQIGQWKRNLLDGAAELFTRRRNRDAEAHEVEKDRLYQQIGKLQDVRTSRRASL
jgi:transposase